MGDLNYTTVSLEGWEDFKSYIGQFSMNWAFRGQESEDWVLSNAIERTAFINYHPGIEADFVAEFQRGARNYLSKDETPGHLIEWLALMQHHGAPTRLLDLTWSPFVAAYFAYEQCLMDWEDSVTIWGLNINYLKNRALEVLSEEFGERLNESRNLINEAVFEKIFYQNNKRLVFPVEPFSMNRRYSLQQSVFVSTGIAEVPLMEQLSFLGDSIGKAVVKILVPSRFKNYVMRDLQRMNLHRASLFPDLDGYAASLRLRYESRQTPDETMEEHAKKLANKDYPFFP